MGLREHTTTDNGVRTYDEGPNRIVQLDIVLNGREVTLSVSRLADEVAVIDHDAYGDKYTIVRGTDGESLLYALATYLH
jgi:hypothetical protein